MLFIPADTTPSQTAIIRVYVYETRDPVKIAALLHYKDPSPVYKVLKQYRDMLRKTDRVTASVTLAVAR